jgi:hypothetical protein
MALTMLRKKGELLSERLLLLGSSVTCQSFAPVTLLHPQAAFDYGRSSGLRS